MRDPFAVLLMTRPRAQARHFAAQLDVPNLQVIMSPLLEIVPTGLTPVLDGIRGVIFTSENGVRFAGDPQPLPTYCVGAKTTRAACDAGWPAEMVGQTSDDLVQALTEQKSPSPLLHIGGIHRRGDIADRLTQARLLTHEIDVYNQRLLPLSDKAQQALGGTIPVIVPLFSPRTARQFAQEANPLAPLHLVAISQNVMDEAKQITAISRNVAETPDSAGIKRTLRNLLRRVEARDRAS